jgi:hypothetical protein
MALEAWRSHLRHMHDYLPDRIIPNATHLDHVKILNAALTDYKRQWEKQGLYGRRLLEFNHEQYAPICRKYKIPEETCSPSELMRAVERRDMNVVYRKRCCPINKFYSMIITDTPGFISAPDKSIRKPVVKSQEQRPAEKSHHKEDPIRKDAQSNPIRRNPAINPMAGGSDNTPWNHAPTGSTKLDVLIRKPSVNQRDLKKGQSFNPIAGEEKGDDDNEGGDGMEDVENSLYDNRMVPADKKVLMDVLWKINCIKTKHLPKEYTTQRQNALDKAQREFEARGQTPAYLDGVKPPWNGGVGLAFARYNEMILAKLEMQLSLLRESNAQACKLKDASLDTNGPRGQGRR